MPDAYGNTDARYTDYRRVASCAKFAHSSNDIASLSDCEYNKVVMALHSQMMMLHE